MAKMALFITITTSAIGAVTAVFHAGLDRRLFSPDTWPLAPISRLLDSVIVYVWFRVHYRI